MKKEIENRIAELGGRSAFNNDSLLNDLMSISFNKSFLFADFWDYLVDYDSFNQELLKKGFIEDVDVKCMQFEFEVYLWTPFLAGSDDYETEMEGYLDDEILNHVNSVITSDISELVVLGYMDLEKFFICLADENPENPKVYRTDMEIPFSPIGGGVTVEGTLEDFLSKLLSQTEYKLAVKSHINSL